MIKMPATVKDWIILGLRLFFAGTLIYASIDKILNPIDFAQTIFNYQIIGVRLSRWVAIWLPYLELILGLFLLAGIWLKSSARLNLSLMLIFLVAVGQAYFRGLKISCGCFAVDGPEKIGIGDIFSNIALLLASIVLVLLLEYNPKKST